ncbi:MAG: TRAP transporter small permease [Deltaproteobacteria bacterium]|nr:TRAP transporter small permease [Deltaproteobacteria bacterium]
MVNFFIWYQIFLDKLERAVFFLACALLALLLGNVLMGILSDTIGYSITWVPEMSVLLFAWVCFLGAGAIARHGGHIGVDFLIERFPPGLHSLVRVGHVILTVLLAGVMIYFGIKNAFFVGKYQSSVYLDLSLFYYYSSVPVGGLLLALNSIGAILPDPRKERSLKQLASNNR